MAQLKIKRGTSSNLNSVSVVDGQLIITTDTKEIYLDNNSSRIRLAAPPPVTSVNGRTGAVNLNYSDVGASPSQHTHSSLINSNYTLNWQGDHSLTPADRSSTSLHFGTSLLYRLYNSTYYQIYDQGNKPTYTDVGAPSTTGTNASGTWNISAVQLAPYSTAGEYGKNSLAYFNTSVAHNGTARLGVNDSPFSSATWCHFLRFTHANNSGYYTDLCIPFNANSIYYKRVNAGAVINSSINYGWVQVLDQLNYTNYAATKNHTHSYLPLSGGTMTGPIIFADNTWNLVGDDAAFGDHNQAGAVCFKSLNHNETSLILYNPSETALGTIKLDGSNNLILYADGGIVYSVGTLGVGATKNIYFDLTAVSRGISWEHYQSGKTSPHVLKFLSGANDGANAANGYWGDIQMHANSDTPTNMYVTRWQDGVEQGRICLLDQYNNTWKTSGSFYLRNNGRLVCEWNNNGVAQTGITIWADNEGGNIEFYSPTGNRFQMDAYDGNWRMFGIVNNAYTGQITVTPYGQLYGAVWNDYAEYRESNEQIQPGRIVIENGDDTLSISTKRLQPGASIVSDTYGFAIGETSRAKTPLAVSGRALAYTFEPRDSFSAGDAVCSGPNGTVSKMTREEIVMYPERIIGYVSAIPTYKNWGQNNVEVNGRIWIRVT